MFSVSTSFCLVLDKLSNCLALADIQLFYLFLMRRDRPYLYFSIDVVLPRFCVTSNSFLSPFTFFLSHFKCYVLLTLEKIPLGQGYLLVTVTQGGCRNGSAILSF